VTALRIGNVAGADSLLAPRPGANRAAPLVIDRYPDGGTPRRSYIGPGTLAEALIGLATLPGPLPDVLNIAAPAPIEMADLARAARCAWLPRPRSDTAGRSITLDCTRLWGLLPAPAEASDPQAMVRQIQTQGSAA
jgi:nucleoside-diphosphate-sugar epimerase